MYFFGMKDGFYSIFKGVIEKVVSYYFVGNCIRSEEEK